MRAVHANRTYKCAKSGCPAAFPELEGLSRHVGAVHTIQRRYKCLAPDCVTTSKSWSRLDSLRRHVRQCHPAEDPERLLARQGYTSGEGMEEEFREDEEN